MSIEDKIPEKLVDPELGKMFLELFNQCREKGGNLYEDNENARGFIYYFKGKENKEDYYCVILAKTETERITRFINDATNKIQKSDVCMHGDFYDISILQYHNNNIRRNTVLAYDKSNSKFYHFIDNKKFFHQIGSKEAIGDIKDIEKIINNANIENNIVKFKTLEAIKKDYQIELDKLQKKIETKDTIK